MSLRLHGQVCLEGTDPRSERPTGPKTRKGGARIRSGSVAAPESHLPPRPCPVKWTWHPVQSIVPWFHSLPVTFSPD